MATKSTCKVHYLKQRIDSSKFIIFGPKYIFETEKVATLVKARTYNDLPFRDALYKTLHKISSYHHQVTCECSVDVSSFVLDEMSEHVGLVLEHEVAPLPAALVHNHRCRVLIPSAWLRRPRGLHTGLLLRLPVPQIFLFFRQVIPLNKGLVKPN